MGWWSVWNLLGGGERDWSRCSERRVFCQVFREGLKPHKFPTSSFEKQKRRTQNEARRTAAKPATLDGLLCLKAKRLCLQLRNKSRSIFVSGLCAWFQGFQEFSKLFRTKEMLECIMLTSQTIFKHLSLINSLELGWIREKYIQMFN